MLDDEISQGQNRESHRLLPEYKLNSCLMWLEMMTDSLTVRTSSVTEN